MRLINLGEKQSVLNRYVTELRDIEIQKDAMRFRRNLERIGEYMAYEISKTFTYSSREIVTPLGKVNMEIPDGEVVLGTILRVGIPFHQGFLNCFDQAGNAFVSAYRKYKDSLKFDIHIEYIASPALTGKTLIITDPMLATGSSMELAYKALLTRGTPSKVHIASIIASEPSISYLKDQFPVENITVWTAALDPCIDDHSYIVPGLGDAGDLAYGMKEG